MQTLFCAFLIYIGIMFVIIYCKPKLMYDQENKSYRPFGTSNNATLFPMWICAVVVAVASYMGSLVVCSPVFASTPALSQPTTDQLTVLPSMRRATVGGSHDSSFRPHHHSNHKHNNNQQTDTFTQHPQQQHLHPHYHPHHQQPQHPQHHGHHFQSFAHPHHRGHHTYHHTPPSHVGASRVWKHTMN